MRAAVQIRPVVDGSISHTAQLLRGKLIFTREIDDRHDVAEVRLVHLSIGIHFRTRIITAIIAPTGVSGGITNLIARSLAIAAIDQFIGNGGISFSVGVVKPQVMSYFV